MKNETWSSFSSEFVHVHFLHLFIGLNSVWVLFQNIVVPNTEEGRIETVIELQQPNTVLGLSQSTFIIVTCEYSQVFHFFESNEIDYSKTWL